ncbi:family 10 glycosylhydrolase [Pararhodonellum marinum]|uniref:family 10 glycosylhydrolase n=1 Tax=Pararhodonellum marinum TaxID=2755358 RepID=UPI00188FE3DA|nr:family 10 glycosylhydrolase [Pararhodonellum marinum]
MKKRTFIRNLGLGSLALTSPWMWSACQNANADHGTKNWIWMTPKNGLSKDNWKRELDRIKAHGLDAVLFESYNGRKASFETDRLPMGEPILEILIEHGQNIGLEVHAWMFSMPCNIPEIAEKHPDWFAVNGLGQPSHSHPAYVDYYKFLCPAHPEAMEFVRGTVQSLAEKEGLTGVHLDYIRLPDVILAEALQPKYNIVQDKEYPEYDYCYHELTREKFKAIRGIDPLKDLEDPTANQEWKQFRQDLITDLVNDTFAPEIKSRQKQATAAVFPNWESVRQEWSKWELDAFLPMLYHNFYNQDIQWVGNSLKVEIAALSKAKPVYAGLFVPELTPEELNHAIEISRNAGGAGISLFQHWSMQEGHWEAVQKK